MVRGAVRDPDDPPALAALGLARPGLVVAYDLDGLAPASREALQVHRPGQVLYSQGVSWTEEPAFAADLVLRLHQFSRAPWDGFTGVDPKTGTSCEVLPDDADVATLAARIADAPLNVAAEVDAAADRTALLALADAARSVGGDAVPGALRSAGPRRRAWCGSPVQSLRFG